jgi:hypothetical protein
MHHGLNVDTTRIHHTLPPALVAAVAQYVLEGNLWSEPAMLIRVGMHEQVAVPT